jgi:DNA-binding PadR family transcriptional regulator
MSLRHAILGFLRFQPMSGYDLKRAFDASVRHFWSADRAQIYRTLAELQAGALVEVERVPGEGRPDRLVHRLTPAGAAALEAWLSEPAAAPPRREPFLLKLFLSDGLGPGGRDALFAAEIQRNAEELRQLEQVMAELQAAPSPPPAGPLLSLEAGLASLQDWGAWLERTRARLGDGA